MCRFLLSCQQLKASLVVFLDPAQTASVLIAFSEREEGIIARGCHQGRYGGGAESAISKVSVKAKLLLCIDPNQGKRMITSQSYNYVGKSTVLGHRCFRHRVGMRDGASGMGGREYREWQGYC